jgi:hypothetical protein
MGRRGGEERAGEIIFHLAPKFKFKRLMEVDVGKRGESLY